AHLAVHAAPLEEGELDGELEGVPRGVVDRDLQPLHARPHRLPRRVLPHPEQQPARRTAALQLPAHRPEHVPVALRQRGAAQVAPLDRRAPPANARSDCSGSWGGSPITALPAARPRCPATARRARPPAAPAPPRPAASPATSSTPPGPPRCAAAPRPAPATAPAPCCG